MQSTASVVQWPEFLTANSKSSGFDSRRYQIFCVAVGLQRGPLSLLNINEELLERKVAVVNRYISLAD
jgi:hypothetical protein